jgi:Cyclin-dependent kinase inhibitor
MEHCLSLIVSKLSCFIVKVAFVEAQMEQYNFDFVNTVPLDRDDQNN